MDDARNQHISFVSSTQFREWASELISAICKLGDHCLGRVWLHINVKAELRWSADTAVAYPVRFKYLRTKSHGLCGNSLGGR